MLGLYHLYTYMYINKRNKNMYKLRVCACKIKEYDIYLCIQIKNIYINKKRYKYVKKKWKSRVK